MSVASEVTVSDSSGLQIFTTIDEPYYTDTHEGAGNAGQRVGTGGQETVLSSSVCASETVVTRSECGVEEEYVVQGSRSCEETAVDESESSSIYQLLFQLPSVTNTSLCTAVVCMYLQVNVIAIRCRYSALVPHLLYPLERF